MHGKNAIEVPDGSNVGASASIDTRGQARSGGSPKFPNLEDKMRQVSIDGDGGWPTTIEYLIEDRNARVHEGLIAIGTVIARAIVLTIFSRAIVPVIVRRAIDSAIIIGIIATLTDKTKRILNFTELIHITLTGEKALDIRCLFLLRGAIPIGILA